jgi:small subunit ribosomal protein S6
MNKYEAMFIFKPDLSEEDKKAIFNQAGDAITKHGGSILSANVWAEKKRLTFPIKKQVEALYYLLSFAAPALSIKDIRHAYKLNENILRALISRIG